LIEVRFVARKDAIKLALVLAAIGLVAYGASRRYELWVALAPYTDEFYYPASTDDITHLLEPGANPNNRSHDGMTVLHAAVQKRDIGVVQLLLEHGANPTLENDAGMRPMDELHYTEDRYYFENDIDVEHVHEKTQKRGVVLIRRR
jgi:hypothetical protein